MAWVSVSNGEFRKWTFIFYTISSIELSGQSIRVSQTSKTLIDIPRPDSDCRVVIIRPFWFEPFYTWSTTAARVQMWTVRSVVTNCGIWRDYNLLEWISQWMSESEIASKVCVRHWQDDLFDWMCPWTFNLNFKEFDQLDVRIVFQRDYKLMKV